MFAEQQIYAKLYALHSLALKQELLSFLDYLLNKQNNQIHSLPKRMPKFGCAKGKFKMSADFDAPLDHFQDYMPL